MSTELAHYGVKGMKWGVIRKRENPLDVRNKNYSDKARAEDVAYLGERYAKYVNRSMNKGHKLSSARNRAFAKDLAVDIGKEFIVVAPVAIGMTTFMFMKHDPALRQVGLDGAAAVGQMLGYGGAHDAKGANMRIKSKTYRGGYQNITTMGSGGVRSKGSSKLGFELGR